MNDEEQIFPLSFATSLVSIVTWRTTRSFKPMSMLEESDWSCLELVFRWIFFVTTHFSSLSRFF